MIQKEHAAPERCELCNGGLKRVGIKLICNSKYTILKCEKCKHTVARSYGNIEI